MNPFHAPYIFLLFPLIASCGTMAAKREQCEASIRAYNKMIRWKEYDDAEKAVVRENRPEFTRRLEGMKSQIADYRIKSMSCDAEKGEAEALIEYDYFIPPSTTLKTTEDTQKWHYFSTEVPGGWRVVTPLPGFIK